MIIALSTLVLQQLTFLSYLMESSFFTKQASEDTRALMFAVALFSAFLSVPSFVWNYSMNRAEKKKRHVVFTGMSVATFAFGIVYVVFAIVQRFQQVGVALF